MSTVYDIENTWIFSLIDRWINKEIDNPNKFIALFDRKVMLIGLVKSLKIDAKKYKTLVAKAYKEGDGEVKECASLDISKLKDAKNEKVVEEWFKEMIEATGKDYEKQEMKW